MIKTPDIKISNDICGLLAEEDGWNVKDGADAMYDDTSCYQHIDIGADHHNFLWSKFCEDIKHGSRFFSLSAKETLCKVFDNINDFSSVSGKKTIRDISGSKIFRARKANTLEEIKKIATQPSIELAAPPKHLAVNGRMNPVGVSFFYGAFDKDTCLSELRPAVGETLICGEFTESKPLRVFDFTVLNNIYTELSMFDPDYSEKYSQLSFLKDFESIISKAYLPDDTDLEYLPLQVMTEYISSFLEGGVDGVIFPSAQKNSTTENIVVFDCSNSAYYCNCEH
jgi:hypothetical protein